jgi:Flp pilus assembly protein TadG
VTRSLRDDRGAIAIVVALLSVVLFGMAAFTVDFGRAYVAKRQLSTAADAGALDAAAALGDRPGHCDVVLEDTSAAEDAARTGVADNAGFGGSMSNFTATARRDQSTDECLGVDLQVDDAVTIQTIFGTFAGISSTSSSRSATAEMSVTSTAFHLRPYAVCQGINDDFVDDGATTEVVSINKPSPDCDQSEPGNFGIVDLGGGVTDANVAAWTRSGADHSVTVPVFHTAEDPGDVMTSQQVQDALSAIVGRTVLFPVLSRYNQVGGTGGVLRITGFLPGTLCDWRVGPNREPSPAPCHDDAATTAADTANLNQYIEIAWVRGYTTSYVGGSATCLIGGGCDAGARTIRLVR